MYKTHKASKQLYENPVCSQLCALPYPPVLEHWVQVQNPWAWQMIIVCMWLSSVVESQLPRTLLWWDQHRSTPWSPHPPVTPSPHITHAPLDVLWYSWTPLWTKDSVNLVYLICSLCPSHTRYRRKRAFSQSWDPSGRRQMEGTSADWRYRDSGQCHSLGVRRWRSHWTNQSD